VRNASVLGDQPGDVVFDEAGVVLVEPRGDVRRLDLGGRLLAPCFAEPHVHLDRAFSMSLTGWNRSGTLLEAIARYRGAVARMSVEALASGARRALELMRSSGVGHVRTHTAVGEGLGFRAWEAVERAASEVPDVQVRQVSMPLGGAVDHPDGVAVAKEAAARGQSPSAAQRGWPTTRAGPQGRWPSWRPNSASALICTSTRRTTPP
jgi:cytosine deaminase